MPSSPWGDARSSSENSGAGPEFKVFMCIEDAACGDGLKSKVVFGDSCPDLKVGAGAGFSLGFSPRLEIDPRPYIGGFNHHGAWIVKTEVPAMNFCEIRSPS